MLQMPLLAASLPGKNLFLNVDFLFVRASLPGIPSYGSQGTPAKGASPASLKLLPVQTIASWVCPRETTKPSDLGTCSPPSRTDLVLISQRERCGGAFSCS